MPMTGREAALKALTEFRRRSVRPDKFLDELAIRGLLPQKETALAYRLCMGVMQNAALCDYYIRHYLSSGVKKLHPAVLDILRLCVYQIVFLDRIPVSAAVNESVRLAGRLNNRSAASLVNAVSRRIAENRDKLPEVAGETRADYLSVLYSHPKSLVEYLISRLGEDGAELFLSKNNENPKITVRLNALLSNPENSKTSLNASGADCRPHPWLPGFFEIKNSGKAENLPSFVNGKCTVQDPASALAVYAAGIQKGFRVLDACAAPGGKTFLIAEIMRNSGRILACDINEKKTGLIKGGLTRLGIRNTECAVMDAKTRNSELIGKFDAVLMRRTLFGAWA
jgi:16S rRNA (cytosine967-C5)-methyltransferase